MTATCDGCGRQDAARMAKDEWLKPEGWYQRSDEDGIQIACSRKCIEDVAKKTGKTNAGLPF